MNIDILTFPWAREVRLIADLRKFHQSAQPGPAYITACQAKNLEEAARKAMVGHSPRQAERHGQAKEAEEITFTVGPRKVVVCDE
jgi:hypothetical protein